LGDTRNPVLQRRNLRPAERAYERYQCWPFLGFAAQVKTIFLLLILLTVLWVRMPSSLFADLQTLPADSEPESNLG
jgi:hypothetical protein